MAPTMHTGVAILPLLVLVGFVVGFILLPRKGKAILGVILAVVAVAGLAGVFLFQARDRSATDMDARMRQQMEQQKQWDRPSNSMPLLADRALPPVWNDAIDREFTADGYPSVAAAAEGAMIALQDQLKTWTGDTKPLPAVCIVATAPTTESGNLVLRLHTGPTATHMSYLTQTVRVDHEVMERIAREIKALYPEIQCQLYRTAEEAGAAMGGDTDLKLEVMIERLSLNQPTRLEQLLGHGVTIDGAPVEAVSTPPVEAPEAEGLPYPAFEGRLQVKLSGPHGSVTESTSFYNKPWINNPSHIMNQVPGFAWQVVYSQTAAQNPDLAHQQAIAEAIKWITSHITLPSGQIPEISPIKHVLAFDEAQLREWGMLADFYTQKFQGSAGPIWRAAALVRVTPESLNRANAWTQRRQCDWRSMVFLNTMQLAGLILIIFGLYIFLNYATKGYYSMALKLLAGVVLAVAVVLMVIMA